MSMSTILPDGASVWFLQSLVHFLWQGFFILLVAGAALSCIPHRTSRLSYASWYFTLLLMMLCVPVNFTVLSMSSTPPHSSELLSLESETAPIKVAGSVNSSLESQTDRFVAAASHTSMAQETTRIVQPKGIAGWESIAPYAVLIYACGALLMLGRLGFAFGGGNRLRGGAIAIEDPKFHDTVDRCARTIGLRIRPCVAWCSRVSVPVVVGVVKPIVLLPFSVTTSLDEEQLRSVLMHEFAHIRRLDPWMNALQRIIESLLFFHPGVWVVSRQISIEREYCCDDLVLDHGSDACRYADSLVSISELRSQRSASGLSSAIGAINGNRTQLRIRIMRILGQSTRNRLVGFTPRSVVFGLLLMALGLLPVVLTSEATDMNESPQEPEHRNEENEEDANASQSGAGETDVRGPREVANEWMNLVRQNKLNDALKLTTRSSEPSAHHDLLRVKNKAAVRIVRSLGNASVVVAVTNTVKNEHDEDCAFAFWLVRRGQTWLINMSYQDEPKDVEEQIRGFLAANAGGGVQWHVTNDDMVGDWKAGPRVEACITKLFLDRSRTFRLETYDPAGDLTLERGTWRIQDDSLIQRFRDRELVNKILWIGTDLRVMRSRGEKASVSFQRIQSASPDALVESSTEESGPDFLKNLPDFRGIDLSMSQSQLVQLLAERALTVSFSESKDVVSWHIFNSDGENIVLMFSRNRCVGIQRLRPSAARRKETGAALRLLIDGDGKISTSGAIVTDLDDFLRLQVRNHPPREIPILLRVDTTVRHDRVIEILDRLANHGFAKISFATADRHEDDIVWGRTVDGLQSGLALKTPGPVRVGQTVEFEFRLRNVSDKPLTVSYSQMGLRERPLSFKSVDSNTKLAVTVQQLVGKVRGDVVTLSPNQMITIHHPGIALIPPTETPGEFPSLPTVPAKPGDYLVTQETWYRITGSSKSITSGPVKVRIVEP